MKSILPFLSQGIARLRRDWRQLGPRYAAVEAIYWLGTRLITRPALNRLLIIESDLGMLGPGHRLYQGHTVEQNRDAWGSYPWRADAEDWTWSSEWKQAMLDHLVRPTMSSGGSILEIGPGGGRWSKHLVELGDELILVDVTDQTLEICRERLPAAANVRFVRNHGADLDALMDESVDRVWSFDVFVHIAPVDIASYLSEVARVLRPGGVAIIHHAGAARPLSRDHGWRSPMSAKLFANLARASGLEIDRQLTSWPGSELPLAYGDIITVASRRASAAGSPGGAT